MKRARFRFYAELNDFLPPPRRGVEFEHAFVDRASVKDMVEALGVPHTEIDLILVDGTPVEFSYPVRDGDRISVYPVFEALDIAELTRLRPEPLRIPRFVLDTHLGRLARYLRLLGFDALYSNDRGDAELARLAGGETRRILLTRDRGLLKRSAVTHGYCVRSAVPREQIVEVLDRFDLRGAAAPFTRCISCNTPLRPAPRHAVRDRVPPRVWAGHAAFAECPGCGRVYWRGTHFARLDAVVGELLGAPRPPPA